MTDTTNDPDQFNCQPGRGNATRQQWYHPAAQPAEKGSPRKGYQSPPQSSSKPPDSAERCEWLSAAMRLAERLAMRRPRSMESKKIVPKNIISLLEGSANCQSVNSGIRQW